MNTIILVVAGLAFAVAESLPQNCEEIHVHTLRRYEVVKSGPFKIYPTNENANGLEVFCDMETAGGGWLVIQRRQENDAVDFYNDWDTYANGFGNLQHSFWLGLEASSRITHSDNYVLRVDLTDWEGEERFAEYGYFHVGNSTEQYKLTLNDYSGNAGDSLANHNGMKFTTKDRDNDEKPTTNCAEEYHGAWWYKNCHKSNLNGRFNGTSNTGVIWSTWHTFPYSLKRVEMKIRTSCYSKVMRKHSA